MNPLLTEYTTPHSAIPFDKIRNEHFKPAILQGIEEEDKEIEAIVGNPESPTFANTIEALENTGETLRRATDVFYNLLSAETTDELDDLAQELSPILSDHDNNISFNERLFERVKSVFNAYESTDFEGLTKEQRRLLESSYKGFVRSGANLDGKSKEKLRDISARLSVLTLQFSQNKLKDTNAFSLHITDKDEISGLPESALDLAAEEAKTKGKEGWVFTLQAPSYMPFMTYCDNAALRQHMYMAYNTLCTHDNEYNNLDICTQLVNLRQEKAQLLGYSTYADYVLEHRMAESTENVTDLLNQLIDAYKPKAEEEIKAVTEYARKLNPEIDVLQPWDFSYYSNKLKEEQYNINSELLRPYFQLENVKEGIFGLATRLYGITFRHNPELPVYHEDVEAYEVYDKNGEYIALFYCDFFPRESKKSGAWMTNYQEQWIDGNGINHRPIVSIVTNFMKPTGTKPSLLSLGEVETFLHEFGHSLHGIFADTKYRSLSGTNVYWDFVELPSQIMENFSIEKDFLCTFARHYQTGEVLPDELTERIIRSRNFNVAYACMRQVSFGLLDMAYYSLTQPLGLPIPEFEDAAWKRAQVLPHVDGTCMTVQFGHIMAGGYSAGYYSYKWAEVLDADAFDRFKQEGIFNTEVSESFRKNILSKGNTEHPMTLYKRFRGKAPSIKALLKRNGIIAMICILLCTIFPSCSRNDDLDALFIGRTLYMISGNISGQSIASRYPKAFYGSDNNYTISFSETTYTVKLSEDNIIQGEWSADNKSRKMTMQAKTTKIENSDFDKSLYNQILKRISSYSGDATFITIYADEANKLVLSDKRTDKSIL